METPLSTSGNLPPKPGTRAPLQLSGLDFKLLRVAVAEAECNTVIDLKLEHDAA